MSRPAGSGAQCLAVAPDDPDTVYAGVREGGVRRTVDAGRTWLDGALPEPGVFSLAVSAVDGAVYAGTEPSPLLAERRRRRSWRELDGLLELPSRPSWSFPPRPRTSHVRWIASSRTTPIYCCSGWTGRPDALDRRRRNLAAAAGAQRDVHSLAWHPRVPGRAYEAGGGGAAFSTNGGETWEPADEGRDRHYTWSVAVDPDDPDTWYLWPAPARAPPRASRPGGAVYGAATGRCSWQPLAGGYRTPLPAMPYALLATGGGRLFAGFADGQIWESRDGGDSGISAARG